MSGGLNSNKENAESEIWPATELQNGSLENNNQYCVWSNI